MANQNNRNKLSTTGMLWIATAVLAFGLLFARAVWTEYLWLTIVLAVALLGALAALIQQNHQALRTRSAAYGINSVITVLLVIGILGVVNFLAERYPGKLDLTKNKIHTLSDQTDKLIKGLKQPVKAILFAKVSQREQIRPLLESYKNLNPKFEVEYVDPDKEPTRAKNMGIKKYGTLSIAYGTKENKIDDVTEEKLTNSLVKLLKDKNPTLCAVTGHGEKSFSATDSDGYDQAKKALNDQSYDVRDINLIQDQKTLSTCDAIALLGPTKAFFDPEVKILDGYLAGGGRAIIAVDINLKGPEYASEIMPILKSWYVFADDALVVDPFSQMMGGDAAVPLISTYSKDSAITKDFHAQCFFPFTRPLVVLPGAPAGTHAEWIAQTNPNAWGIVDLKSLAAGSVKSKQPSDKAGPLNVAVAVEGKVKDSKATRNTRLAVFGTSFFASNKFARFGGNQDLFLNTASWVLEDESSISIHTKEEGPGKVELTQKAGTFIFLLTVVLIPALISISGIVIWAVRRRW